jgi:hypothetical protein
MSALSRLCDLVAPPFNGKPGAVEAGVPEFFDFLMTHESADRKALFRGGLAILTQKAKSDFGKSFAELSAAQADSLLKPLREPYQYGGPKDPAARFLHAVRQEAVQATLNSREWAEAGASRRAAGLNYYWRSVE